jgi:hypothetical protein
MEKTMRRKSWTSCAVAIAFLAAFLQSVEAAESASVLRGATAVWHMDAPQDSAAQPSLPVEVHGNVAMGVALSGPDRDASRQRGGDGRVARFDGGYLRVASDGKEPLRLAGKAMTLCVRMRSATIDWNTPLFAKADPSDKFGDMLYGRDGKLHYLWRTEPASRRIVGLGDGGYGFNGEGNDQHHLAGYYPGAFALSTLTLDDRGNVALFHNGSQTAGRINASIQNVGDAGFRIGAKRTDCEFLDGDIAEILVFQRIVSDRERIAIERHLAAKWRLPIAQSPTAGDAMTADKVLSLDGLVLDLDASDIAGDSAKLKDAGLLAAWKSKTADGRVFAQNDAAKRPSLVMNALGGKPVVRFAGRQYLDGPAVLPAGCKNLTFIAIWKRNHASQSQVVFEQSSPGAGRRASLLTVGGGGGNPNFLDGVLRLSIPTATIDPVRWHDVVARFRGANLELFVDGVLVDEEWPHGALYQFRGPFLIGAGYEDGRLKTGFKGDIDHVALWNRALSDEEIVAISGGRNEVARRDREILGPVQESVQYWKPRGQAFAGDCIPFYHDGTFHLFYLFDRRHHGSKWGLGAHQYAHVSSQDLIHWTHHPKTVPITEQWECSIGTCDVVFNPNDKKYYAFYTDCGSRAAFKDKPQQGHWIFAAKSTDGIHFEKDLKPLVPGHDCAVFRDPATGLFHLVRGGGNRLVSSDLAHWKEIPGAFVDRGPGTTDECPNHFEWNGWFYFILGTNAVWKSRSAIGPWEAIDPNIYDGLFVPKVAAFTGNRRLMAGFLTYPGWGGHIALRELVQKPDGSLGVKFAPEVIPATDAPVQPGFVAACRGVAGNASRMEIKADGERSLGILTNVPKNVRITLRVVPKPGVAAFGVCVRGKGDYESGCELRFEPERRRAQYGTLKDHREVQDASGAISQGRDFAIQNVNHLDHPFTLDIVVKDNIIDTCIDQERTMISRRDPEPDGDRLFFFVRKGTVTFEDIVVRPLSQQHAKDR